jgi:type IV pilus assembly protein PilA
MFDARRQNNTDEDGFTLIELLVVILIIGILAAVAIPAFLSQKGKADDTGAKTQVGTLQTAMETYSTENSGSYAGVTLPKLEAIEPSLAEKTSYVPSVGVVTAEEYNVTSEAVATKDKFTLSSKAGVVSRTCTTAGKNGCPAAGTW